MDAKVDEVHRSSPVPAKKPATKPVMQGRGRLVGSLIAILALLALGWLVWHLTRPQPEGGPAAGRGPRAAAGPGGPGMPTSTVGVGTAERTDLPVTLEAIG